MEINSAAIKDAIAAGSASLIEMIRVSFEDLAADEYEAKIQNVIDVGIENTIRAFLEVNTEDATAVLVLHETWGLPKTEAAEQIANTKRRVALDRLDEFLLLQGFRKEEIEKFYRDYSVLWRLRNEKELFALWNKPDRLYSELLKMGEKPCPQVRVVPWGHGLDLE